MHKNNANLCAIAALSAAVAAAQACKSDAAALPATGITVAITTDGTAGSDYDLVTLSVFRNGQTRVHREWPAGSVTFPNTFALEPAPGASLSEPVQIVVEASKGGVPRVRRTALVSFHEGVHHLLRMPLCQTCTDASCPSEVQTCKQGSCQSAAIDVGALPPYTGGGVLDDGECSGTQDGGAGGSGGSGGDCTPTCQDPVKVCLQGTCVQCQFNTHCPASGSSCMSSLCDADHTCRQTPNAGVSCGANRGRASARPVTAIAVERATTCRTTTRIAAAAARGAPAPRRPA
jgi:hypothetical protein